MNGKQPINSFHEEEALQLIKSHIDSTYGQHYVGKEKHGRGVQVIDLLMATGSAEGFFTGSILKYVARYGHKNGKNKEDLLKAAHFLCLLLAMNHLDDDETPANNVVSIEAGKQ